jgi:branched-chain amino acid transport system substrate-binding protein
MAHLRAALVTPLSGPLSLYRRTGATALAIWAKSTALPPPWTSVALDVRDTGKDIRAAMQTALATEPDVLFVGSSESFPQRFAAMFQLSIATNRSVQ